MLNIIEGTWVKNGIWVLQNIMIALNKTIRTRDCSDFIGK